MPDRKKHFTVIVQIEEVTPASPGRGTERTSTYEAPTERRVEEIVRVVSRKGSLEGAISKAVAMLEVELNDAMAAQE